MYKGQAASLGRARSARCVASRSLFSLFFTIVLSSPKKEVGAATSHLDEAFVARTSFAPGAAQLEVVFRALERPVLKEL